MSIFPARRARYSPSLKMPSDIRKKIRLEARRSARISTAVNARRTPPAQDARPVEIVVGGNRSLRGRSNHYVSGLPRPNDCAHPGIAEGAYRSRQKTKVVPGIRSATPWV